jgi:isopenicillin N synthase-like dioxygenase
MWGFGFVRVRGHGVEAARVAAAYAAARDFFHLPEAVKAAYVVPGGGGERGYTPFGREHAKGAKVGDLKEFWHTGRELPGNHPLAAVYPPNLWPAEVPAFRADMLALYAALEHAAHVLLEALAEYLGEDPDTFGLMVENGNSILRALRYPPLGGGVPIEGAVRAAAHEDINFITLLVSSTGSGLELLTRDGRWLPVNAEPGEIIADVGDMMSRVTNGFLPSTTHRVVNPDGQDDERFSLPFFVHPRPDTVLRVLPSCVGEGMPEPQPDITGYGFLLERLRELGLVGG